jgi:hypothetical protein
MVMTRGVEMMLLVPSLRSAWMTAAKPLPVVELYEPSAKVAPVGMAEDRLEVAAARAGGGGARGRGEAGGAGEHGGGQIDDPGAAAREIGDAVAQRLPPSSNHCTPMLALLLTSTSTIMASTSTWARRMSSLSMTAMSDFMIFGGAVMMRALVGMSAQMVTLASTFEAPEPDEAAGVAPWTLRPGLRLGGGRGLTLEFVGQLFGVGVQQVAHFGVAVAGARRVEIHDQRLDAQFRGFLTADENAVGAFVGHHFDRSAPAPSAPCP